jgi:hypothetical protein
MGELQVLWFVFQKGDAMTKTETRPVTDVIYGYAGSFDLNGQVALIIVQACDKQAAGIALNVATEYDIDLNYVRAVTIIPGHREDLFPEATERHLIDGPPV